MNRFTSRLVERTPLTGDVSWYTFEVQGSTLAYIPGQFVSFVLTDSTTGAKYTRSYSIAGTPEPGRLPVRQETPGLEGSRFSLAIIHIPQGRGTTQLSTMQIGVELETVGPSGALILKKPETNSPPYVFCANSTGIAPFLSMLQYLSLARLYHPVHVLWGVKTVSDAYYVRELAEYQSAWRAVGHELAITLCLSRETELPASWAYPTITCALGRIQGSLGSLGSDARQYYICGGKEFVIDVKSAVSSQSQSSSISVERFY